MSKTEIWTAIYILGFVVNYYTWRYFISKRWHNDWTWKDVRVVFFTSIASWFSTIVLLFVELADFIEDNSNGKPPKWL